MRQVLQVPVCCAAPSGDDVSWIPVILLKTGGETGSLESTKFPQIWHRTILATRTSSVEKTDSPAHSSFSDLLSPPVHFYILLFFSGHCSIFTLNALKLSCVCLHYCWSRTQSPVMTHKAVAISDFWDTLIMAQRICDNIDNDHNYSRNFVNKILSNQINLFLGKLCVLSHSVTLKICV